MRYGEICTLCFYYLLFSIVIKHYITLLLYFLVFFYFFIEDLNVKYKKIHGHSHTLDNFIFVPHDSVLYFFFNRGLVPVVLIIFINLQSSDSGCYFSCLEVVSSCRTSVDFVLFDALCNTSSVPPFAFFTLTVSFLLLSLWFFCSG